MIACRSPANACMFIRLCRLPCTEMSSSCRELLLSIGSFFWLSASSLRRTFVVRCWIIFSRQLLLLVWSVFYALRLCCITVLGLCACAQDIFLSVCVCVWLCMCCTHGAVFVSVLHKAHLCLFA